MYTLLLTFLTEHPEAETIVKTATQDDGRVGFQSLVTRFEGTGAMATDLIQAESVIKELYYSGEKPPVMDSDTFEKQLKQAYAIIDRRSSRIVYNDEQKLRSLLQERIKADFLKTTLAVLGIQFTAVPLRLTFQQALDAFRLEVKKHNDSSSGARFRRARQQRNISEVNHWERLKLVRIPPGRR